MGWKVKRFKNLSASWLYNIPASQLLQEILS